MLKLNKSKRKTAQFSQVVCDWSFHPNFLCLTVTWLYTFLFHRFLIDYKPGRLHVDWLFRYTEKEFLIHTHFYINQIKKAILLNLKKIKI